MKPRVPLQVSPIFQQTLKNIQKKFKENGFDKSLRDITEDIVNLGTLKELEKNISNIKVDIKIKMDRRKRWIKKEDSQIYLFL